jgi:predicted DNA-binding transcriptional regulator AlpA
VETQETPLLTIPQAARGCGVSRVHMWRLAKSGAVPAIRIGRDGTRGPIRIDPREIDAWVYGAPEEAA